MHPFNGDAVSVECDLPVFIPPALLLGRMNLFSWLLSLRSLSVNGSCRLHGDGFPILTSSCGAVTSEWWAAGSSELHSPSVVSVNLISSGSTSCLQERESSTVNFGCFSSSSCERWCLPYSAASRWVPCFPCPLGPSICTQLAGGSIPGLLSPACFVGQRVPFFSVPRGARARSEGKASELLQSNNSKTTWQRRLFNVWGFFKASCTSEFWDLNLKFDVVLSVSLKCEIHSPDKWKGQWNLAFIRKAVIRKVRYVKCTLTNED